MLNTKLFSCDNCAVVLDGTKIRQKNAERMFQYDPQMVKWDGNDHIPLHRCPVCHSKIELDLTMWDWFWDGTQNPWGEKDEI